MRVLITGGAGFIGTHLTRRLIKESCEVTILDNFNPQIHGKKQTIPEELQQQVKLIVGDVRDKAVFHNALDNQDVVVHLAAETGTGQSMYEVERYEDVNIKGTSILIDYLVNNQASQVKKVVIASSRAIYGEGKYHCQKCGTVYPSMRLRKDMEAGIFEPFCPMCGATIQSLPTDEISAIHPSSFYGLTKQVQEQMVLMFAKTLGISAFALRYQNVYGSGQSLNNPYTGILAIFSNQARNNQPIYIFEDGNESRDFVYIDDVVEATYRCIRPEVTGIEYLNVGSGQKTTVTEVVQEIVEFFNSSSPISINGAFREGDIRHNIADLTKIKRLLNFEPQWKFREGVREFLSWAASQQASTNKYEQSLQEMRVRGLMHG
ncbi:SDR family NAD(P)-dependent oxidoreductase [Calothrix sp. FACHB-1219]|uniref:SDR family NAD(P)-dependent oxidoreductase n=1 Tax=unclassified Calothrix TaxID=2619626 RepID=UPI001682DB76|nr:MULTISPECIES: SDR family NAD(P)-dependent oxidoreductase [unclassified Calothrix]MBD2201302.1 SDR family NAD(P)-dependent oxidoreductase [Calothrix sp. FACHB-168]MBD2215736.1 SDR family NAD(P)-dependent oxidoreductase [Calothrix sp. FACHB-1219]